MPELGNENIPKLEQTNSAKGFFSKLRGRLTDSVSRNREKELASPALEIDFRFSPHGKKSHFEKVDLTQYDVYFPEGAGQDEEAIEKLRAVSRGVISPKEAMRTLKSPFIGHLWGELKAMHNSGIAVGGIDLHGTKANIDKEDELETKAYNEAEEGNLEAAISYIKQYSQVYGLRQRERENYMVSKFPTAINEILDHYPQLKEKQNIRILINLGSVHTAVYHFLKRKGYETRRINTDYALTYFNQAVIRSMWGHEVDNSLAARVLLEYVFDLAFDRPSKRLDNVQLARDKRKLIAAFNYEDIQGVFEKIKTFSHIEQFRTFFVEECKRKGLSIPKPTID